MRFTSGNMFHDVARRRDMKTKRGLSRRFAALIRGLEGPFGRSSAGLGCVGGEAAAKFTHLPHDENADDDADAKTDQKRAHVGQGGSRLILWRILRLAFRRVLSVRDVGEAAVGWLCSFRSTESVVGFAYRR